MNTKIEEAARNIITIMNDGIDPFISSNIGSSTSPQLAEIDIFALLEAIAAIIERLISSWSENCPGGGPFSGVAKSIGFRQRLRMYREARRELYNHNLQGQIKTVSIVNAAVEVADQKTDNWLDELSAEPQRPDWGI